MPSNRLTDEQHMRRCLELARIGMYYVAPNPMVGAVLVDAEGRVIGEGWHRQFGGPHAEVNCMADAARRHPEKTDYSDCTIYVSLEPCSHWGKTPPCANMLVEKKVGRVVVGCLDPNPKVSGKGIQILREAGIKVETGILEDECRALNKRFLCLQEKHRPYVILKWAQTADGFIDKIRDEKTEPQPLVISTPLMKQVVHKMRAENMAIMVGTNTILRDNPRLKTTRWVGRNPIRVTVDRKGVIPADSRIFEHEEDESKRYVGQDEVIVYRENTDWPFILSDLAERGVHSILVEGGAKLLQTIIDSGIWDEAQVETADEVAIGQGVDAPRLQSNKDITSQSCRYEKEHTVITYHHVAGPQGAE